MDSLKSKLAIAVIASVLCTVLLNLYLYRDNNSFISPPPAAPASNAAETTPPPQGTPTGGVAAVIATINWSDPDRPAAVPIDFRASNFLLDTKDGLQVWNIDSLKMVPFEQPLANPHLLEKIWMYGKKGFDLGTLFAVTSPAATSLYWLPDEKSTIADRLDLPPGFSPTALVKLADDFALVCATDPQRALVVYLDKDGLKQLDAPPYPRNLLGLLQQNRIIGQVDGVGEITEQSREGEGHPKQPVMFDTQSCSWKATLLPEPLASARDLVILKQDIAQGMGGRSLAISAAGWRDPKTNEPRLLDTPLYWEGRSQQWLARKMSDHPILPPEHLSGITHTGWVYSADPASGKFAFLESTGNRWRESTQSIPASEGLKLFPIKDNGVLALLIDSKQPGRIVRLFPEKEKEFDTRLNDQFSNYSDGAVSLKNGGALLVLEGAYASLIAPDVAKPEALPSFPQTNKRVSGVQLADGSVVIFGGLSRKCWVSSVDSCKEPIQPSFRWVAEEKQWQPLPSLNVPFAYGINFDGGNSGIFTRYARSDFLLHDGKELYYLTGNILWQNNHPVTPSQLYRWRIDTGTETLAATQLSRSMSTLIELDNGNLAAIGGFAADEPASPACRACLARRQMEVARLRQEIPKEAELENEEENADPEQIVPPCDACRALNEGEHFSQASSCEIYDISKNAWHFGPSANHPGGRAVKLANGKIFKFGLLGFNATDAAYAAETADPAMTQWVAAPPFPLRNPAEVEFMQAIGNQVLIVMAKPQDRYVLWDDASNNWQVHPLPRHSDWSLINIPQYIGVSGQHKLLMIYQRSYEYLEWPPQ